MTHDKAGYRSSGICACCGKWVEKRYGGEGRYLVVCLDCWLKPKEANAR